MRARALAISVLVACGTPPPTWSVDAGPCVPHESPPLAQLLTPAQSFQADVMPMLTRNCGSPSCHGLQGESKGELFLGAQLAKGSDAAEVFAQLVGVASVQLDLMPYIDPGKPETSYLIHKVDGDQCQFDAKCDSGNCERPMPFGTTSLSPDERDTIRRWVAQGAANN